MATQESLFALPAPAQHDASMLPVAKGVASANGSGGGHPFSVQIQDPGVDLAKKTVCIKVRLSTMGNTRKVSTSQIEADADKDLLRVSKHLVASADSKRSGGSTARFAATSTTSACRSRSAFICFRSRRLNRWKSGYGSSSSIASNWSRPSSRRTRASIWMPRSACAVSTTPPTIRRSRRLLANSGFPGSMSASACRTS